MNLILVCMMFLVGMIGSFLEIFKKKSYLIIQWLFILLFVLCILSRTKFDYKYTDFTIYVKSFITGNNLYFEEGYVKYCELIKKIFGNNGKAFILFNACFMMIILSCAIRILNVGINGGGINKFGIKDFVFKSLSTNYISSVLFAFTAYWGCVFAGMTIRQGLGITISILAFSFILVDKKIAGLILLLLSTQFHNSMYIIIPVVFLMLILKKYPSRKFFCWWILLLILSDIIINMTSIFSLDFFTNILNKYSNFLPVTRFFIYSGNQSEINYFSTQYIFYHVMAILMLCMDFKDIFVCKSVFLYYIGLTLGTIFSKTIIVMRMEWVFLPMIIFSIYFYIRDNEYISNQVKFISLSGFALLQMIMALRLLGVYI